MDRNNSLESKQIDPSVALRKESVDRNDGRRFDFGRTD